MAFKNCTFYVSGYRDDGKLQMNSEEFKKWLKKFDANKDGRISREELREAIRARGGWFTRWKAKEGLKAADTDGNGFIDDDEISNLKDFALKHLGIRIVNRLRLEVN